MAEKSIGEKLLLMKQYINEARKQTNILQGKLDSLYEQMAKEFKTTTLEEAEAKILKLDKEIEGLEADILDSVSKLEEKYKWEVK